MNAQVALTSPGSIGEKENLKTSLSYYVCLYFTCTPDPTLYSIFFSILFYTILFYSILFYSILFYYNLMLPLILFYPNLSVLFRSIPFFATTSYSMNICPKANFCAI